MREKVLMAKRAPEKSREVGVPVAGVVDGVTSSPETESSQ